LLCGEINSKQKRLSDFIASLTMDVRRSIEWPLNEKKRGRVENIEYFILLPSRQ